MAGKLQRYRVLEAAEKASAGGPESRLQPLSGYLCRSSRSRAASPRAACGLATSTNSWTCSRSRAWPCRSPGPRLKCGFPSPAEDYLDNPLDFNELLVKNAAATFAVRLSGDSMIGAGLFPGDIAVVDRSVTPSHNCIVLALLDGEFTVKRYWRQGNLIKLLPENAAYSPIEITEERAFEIWGVITRSIRML